MRSWNENHPKARLMAQKRAAILEAARASFLEAGFSGTSMESIAARAGLSIMTLYRHARTKDALFQAVVSQACQPEDGSEEAEAVQSILRQPLDEILFFFAMRFQERLLAPETLGLLRAVMQEHAHFPGLGAVAYDGLLRSHARQLAGFLQARPEAQAWGASSCEAASDLFVSRLIGADLLSALLGLPSGDEEHRVTQARMVARDVLRLLEQG